LLSFEQGCFHRWSLAMHPSRRTLVASLAVLPLATTAAASVDPIFAAIEQHRAALAAFELISDGVEPARYASAEAEVIASGNALLTTTPQTVAGCRALVDFIIEDLGDEAPDTLVVLRQALDRIATAT
jgi:hypothetical protein